MSHNTVMLVGNSCFTSLDLLFTTPLMFFFPWVRSFWLVFFEVPVVLKEAATTALLKRGILYVNSYVVLIVVYNCMCMELCMHCMQAISGMQSSSIVLTFIIHPYSGVSHNDTMAIDNLQYL
jgi:hypothetical protein